MCLRSGKILKITRQSSKNPSIPQNDAPNVEEQPIESKIGGAETSTSVGVTAHVISQM